MLTIHEKLECLHSTNQELICHGMTDFFKPAQIYESSITLLFFSYHHHHLELNVKGFLDRIYLAKNESSCIFLQWPMISEYHWKTVESFLHLPGH